MNNLDYKSIITPVVTSGLLLYGVLTGKTVPNNIQDTIVVDAVAIASFVVTLWGIWKNHQVSKTIETPVTPTPTETQNPSNNQTGVTK